MPRTRQTDIDDFLAQQRIALVGASRNTLSFSRIVLKTLIKRGYEVELVNPNAEEIAGRKCWSRVQEINTPVDCALAVTTPDSTT
jgi:predicted CoA-binding protein